MAGQKKGFIARMLEGKERDESYARSTLPSNRWGLFWDIFKGRFSKLVILNLLMLIFFIPIIAVFIFRSFYISAQGALMPFASGLGVGVGALPNLMGVQESINISTNIQFGLFMLIGAMIASVGISGGIYVIRNMVWTEGIFVANDFWRGIKQNFLQILLTLVIYSAFFTLGILSLSAIDRMTALGGGSALLVIAKILVIIALVFFSICTLHMIAMSVTYKLKFGALLKNAMLFTIAMPFHNVFFLFLAVLPIMLTFLGGIFSSMGYVAILLLAFSYMLLVWTDFAHWAFDRFINDRVPGAKKNRGIYEKISENDSESLKQYRAQLAQMGPSSLSSRPIKPITDDELKLEELPTSFSRKDIEKLNESRRILYEDNEKYIEEHKNDPEFVQYVEQFEKLEKETKAEQEAREKRIAKAQKELDKRNKKKGEKKGFLD